VEQELLTVPNIRVHLSF